jgi:hypothetical protein
VFAAEAAAFAARTGCLFVEALAKTAVGVTEASNDVFARIIDMPSLWREEMSKSSPKRAAGAASGSANTTAAGRSRAGEGMPGNIGLSQVQDEDTSAGCLCSLSGFFLLASPLAWHVIPVANDPMSSGLKKEQYSNYTTTFGNSIHTCIIVL